MTRRGPIAWMAQHGVAPNLLMVVLLLGGLLASLQIKKEVFPDFTLESVSVSVVYSGATPEEIEQSMLLAIESELADIEGIDEITATASEGSGSVVAELLDGVDSMRVYQEIQQAVDGIRTFPSDAEAPTFSMSGHSRGVLDLQLHGQVDALTLQETAESLRTELLSSTSVSKVELAGSRDREVQVLLGEQAMRRYGLTHASLAELVAGEAIDLAGGSLDTRDNEWLVRYQGRRELAVDFARLPILTTGDGGVLRLGDIAEVRDGLAESDSEVEYNGEPGLSLEIYQVGDQTPLGLSETVRGELDRLRADLPQGLELTLGWDSSEVYRERLDLLLKNAWMGLALVLVLMALFLEARLAFWVTLGIPTAFLGALLFLPWFGVSLNMMSMFAFIIALGIVVDDAIMVGENIYAYREQGHSVREAAVRGAREIAVPISFAVLSNIVAFLPLLFLPGFLGMIMSVVPMVVVTVFLVSWLEALFVLPAHLAHSRERRRLPAWQRPLERLRLYMQGRLAHFTQRRFEPFLQRTLDQRLLTVALGVAILCVALAYAMSGRLGFSLMPRVESDRVEANVTLPAGSPIAADRAVRDALLESAAALAARDDGPVFESTRARQNGDSLEVRLEIAAESLADWPPSRLASAWREASGALPGVQAIRFASDAGGPGGGAALTLRLAHADSATLEAAAGALAATLEGYQGVTDIDSGISNGKPQLSLAVSPVGRALGLTGSDLASQLRGPLQGATALKQQRGRSEISVEVRLPPGARDSLSELEQFSILTPDGGRAPLSRVAHIEHGRASASLTRIDGRRVIDVSADVRDGTPVNTLLASLQDDAFPALESRFPGLEIGLGGRQEETADNLATLKTAMWATLAALYVLLAIPFRSYIQPLLVMAAIPFGIIGAVAGHLLMGFGLSIISLLGMLALSGVVINDALVLIDYANRRRREGLGAREAIAAAATRRLRPIMMTTLTTFLGLAPMIFETSRQARFIVPMAVSLGFGILFATLILLVLVPCLYLMVENLRERLAGAPRISEEAS
ncbi:efflux RND transporter permease subunit [Modicisalibacter radicis]|uniref:efflux RND transporter permease subunit n=1 Tax=Halomonas sp. EAR18 TaxID=2518972 RepID=UPI00109CA466|nr:efflux RND transporter permease subunit [Halomonas sp. EAR18]